MKTKFLAGFILMVMSMTLPLFAAKNSKQNDSEKQTSADFNKKNMKAESKSAFDGKRIVVYEPILINTSENDEWIKSAVQRQITMCFQNYSGMQVIDRQALSDVLKEQKLSMDAMYSEESQLEIGTLVAAKYIVNIRLTKKSNGYGVNAHISDTESGELVGSAYTNPDFPTSYLENGSISYDISYALLEGLGIKQDTLDKMRAEAETQKKKAAAAANLEKGLVANASGGTVVSALYYFQRAVDDDSSLTEAALALQNANTVFSTGNLSENNKNEFALRNEWAKIWQDYRDFAKKNYFATIIFSTNVRTETNIEKGLINTTVPIAVSTGNYDLDLVYYKLLAQYNAVPKTGDWGIDTKKVETPYAIVIKCSLLDSNGNEIGSKTERCSGRSYSSYGSPSNEYNFSTTHLTIPVKAELYDDYKIIKIQTNIAANVMEDNRRSKVVESGTVTKYCAGWNNFSASDDEVQKKFFKNYSETAGPVYTPGFIEYSSTILESGSSDYIRTENFLKNDDDLLHLYYLGYLMEYNWDKLKGIAFSPWLVYNHYINKGWINDTFMFGVQHSSDGMKRLDNLKKLYEKKIETVFEKWMDRRKTMLDNVIQKGLDSTDKEAYKLIEANKNFFMKFYNNYDKERLAEKNGIPLEIVDDVNSAISAKNYTTEEYVAMHVYRWIESYDSYYGRPSSKGVKKYAELKNLAEKDKNTKKKK